MDVVVEVLKIIGLVIGALLALPVFLLVLGLLIRAARAIGRVVRRWLRRRRVRRRTAPLSSSAPKQPSFAHVLLVEADDAAGRLAPVVEFAVNVPLVRGRLRLELVDDDGAVRAHAEQRLPRQGALTRARFEPFSPPDGATLADALAWRWDVVLIDASGERARWQEYLNLAGRIDDEAELVAGAGDPEPDAGSESMSTAELIRILREAGLESRSRRERLPSLSD